MAKHHFEIKRQVFLVFLEHGEELKSIHEALSRPTKKKWKITMKKK